ncbi:MAG: hypothetical protein U0Q16_09660 [Bryobacteraceae bacterium]
MTRVQNDPVLELLLAPGRAVEPLRRDEITARMEHLSRRFRSAQSPERKHNPTSDERFHLEKSLSK